MSLSYPKDPTPDSTAAYVTALLDLLGDRDPMDVLRETPDVLRAAVASLDDTPLRTREAEGKWSVVHVVEHLADSEAVYGYRLRSILTEDEPDLPGYDQDRWAELLRYAEGDAVEAAEVFGLLRRRTLRLLAALREEEWERAGQHGERGRESVRHIVRLLAAHDLAHLRQIERIKRAVGV